MVLASASRRLGLYEQEFGFTRLRAAWLPRAVVLSAAAGLLVFALADPDARIAARNVERAALTGDLDADPPAGWNLSRARARDLLAGVPATPCVPVG